jgi:hypothetical protein
VSTAYRLAWHITWAIANTAYTMIACSNAGHPGTYWTQGTRRCNCGRHWPT